MERQGRRRLLEALADFSRRHTLGPALDQQAKNIQARVLRQRPQRRDYSGLVHSSIPLGECQYIGQPDQKASPGRALGLSSLLSPSFCRSVRCPEAKIVLRLERTNTLAQKPFLFPLLILGEGEGEVTRSGPRHGFRLRPLTLRETTARNYSRFEARRGRGRGYTPRPLIHVSPSASGISRKIRPALFSL